MTARTGQTLQAGPRDEEQEKEQEQEKELEKEGNHREHRDESTQQCAAIMS